VEIKDERSKRKKKKKKQKNCKTQKTTHKRPYPTGQKWGLLKKTRIKLKKKKGEKKVRGITKLVRRKRAEKCTTPQKK